MTTYNIYKYYNGKAKQVSTTSKLKDAKSFCYAYLKDHPRIILNISIWDEDDKRSRSYMDVLWADVEGKKKIIVHGEKPYVLNPDGSMDRHLKQVLKVSNGKIGFAFKYR